MIWDGRWMLKILMATMAALVMSGCGKTNVKTLTSHVVVHLLVGTNGSPDAAYLTPTEQFAGSNAIKVQMRFNGDPVHFARVVTNIVTVTNIVAAQATMNQSNHLIVGSMTPILRRGVQTQSPWGLVFSITSKRDSELIVRGFTIEVTKYEMISPLGGTFLGKLPKWRDRDEMTEGHIRHYQCNLKTNMGQYPCFRDDAGHSPYSQFRLQSGETESFMIHPVGNQYRYNSGLYAMTIWMDYLSGDLGKDGYMHDTRVKIGTQTMVFSNPP